MAGKAIPHTQNLAIGKGHTQLMSPTQGQADIIEATLAPAISQPLWGQLYGWLPLSNAYGIFFRYNTTHNLTSIGIFFLNNSTETYRYFLSQNAGLT